MNELNRRLFYHLDDLRDDAGISINDFCEGVCDRRQYSRYKNGRHEITLKNISKFYRKLGFSEIEFYYSFYNSDLSEFPKLNKVYYALVDRKLEKAKDLIKELRDVTFLGERTQRYFEFLVIYYDYLDKQVSTAHTLELLKRLINYDVCITKRFYEFLDIASLRIIMLIEMNMKERQTLDLLYGLLVNDNYVYVTSETRNILPSIYASVSRMYGMIHEFDNVLEITELGIEYSISINSMHLLDNLYYFQSLALYRTNQKEKAYLQARRALEVWDIKRDANEFTQLKELIDKDFDINSMEFFRNFTFDKNGT